MFTRTSNGIGNRALFTGSRFTVYVETDPKCDPTRAVDFAFWHEFFRHFYPDLAITFQPLGGKEQVIAMAEKIIASSIPNSLCAMDADYERHFDTLIDDERVFYTFGYGVENDLINEISASSIMRALLPGLEDIDEHGVRVWQFVEQTISLDRLALVGDQIAGARGLSILDRQRPQADLRHDGKLPVRLRIEKVRQAIKKARMENRKPNRPFSPQASPAAMPAHHFFEIAYQTFVRYIADFTKMKHSHGNFVAICLGCIQNVVFQFMPDLIKEHYTGIGSRNILKFTTID